MPLERDTSALNLISSTAVCPNPGGRSSNSTATAAPEGVAPPLLSFLSCFLSSWRTAGCTLVRSIPLYYCKGILRERTRSLMRPSTSTCILLPCRGFASLKTQYPPCHAMSCLMLERATPINRASTRVCSSSVLMIHSEKAFIIMESTWYYILKR